MRPLFLAALLLAAAPAHAYRVSDLQNLQKRVERIGAKVFWSKGSNECYERNLLGKYVPSKRTLFLCQERLHDPTQAMETLKHESWHAVQHICNSGNAVFTDAKLRSLMSEKDKKTIRALYPKHQQRAEAEARVLEHVPLAAFIRGMNHYCKLT